MRRAFTLIELLVVISIIVILLALLVAALDKALEAAQKGKCAANQRNVAQACQLYATDNMQILPRGDGTTAMDVRASAGVANPTEAQTNNAARGWGHLARTKRIATAKLGDLIHCPSIDTTAAVPVKFGMDELYLDTQECAGGSYWADPSTGLRRIVSSYNYRGKSYSSDHGGAMMITNKIGSAFVLSTDMVTALSAVGARNYGRKYHHRTGWNVAYADGHADFITAVAAKTSTAPGSSRIETDILGDGTTSTTEMNGGGNDEKVFKEMGRGTGAGSTAAPPL